MAIANGAQHSLHYIAETTYGTTPSTPGFTPLPHTGTTLAVTKDAIESETLKGDRQVDDFRHGNKSVSGDVTSELQYGAFDDILEAVLCGSWSTDVLKAGVTRRSFSLQRKFADLATPEFHTYTGCEFNTMSLSVAPNAMVGVTFGVVGKNLGLATAAITGSTFAADPTTSPFDSFTGSISEGGSTIATVTAIELSLENGIEPLFSVGSVTTNRPSIGRSRLSGTLTTYFENKTLYQKFLNETSSSISLTLTDAAGNDYIISLPNVKYNSGQPDVAGEGAVTIAMEFVALYDSTDDSQIKITRTAA
jgi:hypothetical protein|tara:strand:+ start:688 stop:1605 length:918 start_codon:yes stop_codon:yes gene_type:complete